MHRRRRLGSQLLGDADPLRYSRSQPADDEEEDDEEEDGDEEEAAEQEAADEPRKVRLQLLSLNPPPSSPSRLATDSSVHLSTLARAFEFLDARTG